MCLQTYYLLVFIKRFHLVCLVKKRSNLQHMNIQV